jgi:CheY-like chemotaxis protein/HPt (histidine-containing phosphotransfer) domain-containing protein
MSTVDPFILRRIEAAEETTGRVECAGIDPYVVSTFHVLVAEDNPVNQDVAKMMLEMMGCRVDQAVSGIQAVQLAGRGRYDLILMDCQMPEMDGFEAARTIRKLERSGDESTGRRLPIIAMTGNTADEDRDKCLLSGMDDFLKKPFAFEEMQEKVGRWLEIGTPESNPRQVEPPLKEKDSPIDGKYLDNILALQQDGAPDILGKVIDHYFSDSPRTIQRLYDAVAADDGERIRSIAHRFKSGSANLGASRLAEMCREMESSAGASTMIKNRELLASIEKEYRAVTEALTLVLRGRK